MIQTFLSGVGFLGTSAPFHSDLSLVLILISAFITYILPGIPRKLLTGDYAVTTTHAVIGATALLLGLYVISSANGWLPKRLRFRKYKRIMRTTYIFYMLATVLGVVVYALVYIYHI